MNEGDLTTLLRQHARRHAVPGAALGVLREGATTTAYYGVADVRTGEPVAADTLFSLGSLTKPMVATVIARLADEGRFSMDDPVAAHVPELRRTRWAERARLRDLLANRSGLPLRADLEFGFGRRQDRDDGALSRLVAEVTSDALAEELWSYTNVGWCVLGRVIETTTGTSWEDAMRNQLLDVASMGMTTFERDGVPERRVCGHAVTADGPVPVEPLIARAYGPAGTSIVSTVTDLLRFAALHLEDRVLTALRTVQADVSIYGWLDSWCLGWAWFDWEGGPVWGWDGLINGERSVLRIAPEHRAAVVLLTNSGTGRAMYRSLFPELMESSLGIGVPPLRLDASPDAAGDLSRFAGVYAWPDRKLEVTRTEDCLLIESEGSETQAFPLDERTFLVDAADPDNPTVTFGAFDEDGRPGALYEMLWALPRLTQPPPI